MVNGILCLAKEASQFQIILFFFWLEIYLQILLWYVLLSDL